MKKVAGVVALVCVLLASGAFVTSSVLAQSSHPVLTQEVVTLEGTGVRFFAVRDVSHGVTCYYLATNGGGGMQCVR